MLFAKSAPEVTVFSSAVEVLRILRRRQTKITIKLFLLGISGHWMHTISKSWAWYLSTKWHLCSYIPWLLSFSFWLLLQPQPGFLPYSTINFTQFQKVLFPLTTMSLRLCKVKAPFIILLHSIGALPVGFKSPKDYFFCSVILHCRNSSLP